MVTRDMTSDSPERRVQAKTPHYITLYRLAFERFRSHALWNIRFFDEPTPGDALVVGRHLRIEGNWKPAGSPKRSNVPVMPLGMGRRQGLPFQRMKWDSDTKLNKAAYSYCNCTSPCGTVEEERSCGSRQLSIYAT